jgi:hypothetical protein
MRCNSNAKQMERGRKKLVGRVQRQSMAVNWVESNHDEEVAPAGRNMNADQVVLSGCRWRRT